MSAVYTLTAGVIGLVLAWPFLFATSVYLELSVGLMISLGWKITLLSVGALGAGVYVFGRKLWHAIASWNRGDRSEVPALLEMVRVAPRRIAIRTSLIATSVIVIFWYISLPGVGVSSLELFALSIATVAGIQVIALLCAVSFDLLMRPIREEIAMVLPGLHSSSSGRWSIEFRLFASATAMGFVVGALAPAAVVAFTPDVPPRILVVVIGAVLLAVIGGTVFRGLGLRPVLRPIDDLVDGTGRVADGEFTHRLVVTSDDEFGRLVASFNRMQEGLLERERLHTAFGSYVAPDLAEKLLAQGDELFKGEEVEATVFFVDVRDFTAYSERTEASQAVARLNQLFEIVVPTLREHHGHANKFSGDGVLAVFGVPEPVSDHAERAVAAAVDVQGQVRDHFGEGLRIGIGVNTGRVIAGTVGGGGKLEFALIGDPVNVASRVEELTKQTGDPILLTQATVDAMTKAPSGLVPRGPHEVKGKAEPVVVYGLDPFQ